MCLVSRASEHRDWSYYTYVALVHLRVVSGHLIPIFIIYTDILYSFADTNPTTGNIFLTDPYADEQVSLTSISTSIDDRGFLNSDY